MKSINVLLAVCFCFISIFAQAQQGKIVRLNVAGSEIASGQVRIVEKLVTEDGQSIAPGIYNVSLILSQERQAQFVLQKARTDFTIKNVSANDHQMETPDVPRYTIVGEVDKNTLVKGIATLSGTFTVRPFSPTESVMSFDSRQFAAKSVLGRSPEGGVADLYPVSITMEQSEQCGPDCVQGYITVVIRNGGAAAASGKWNIALVDPSVYVGTLDKLAKDADVTVTSKDKIRLSCCRPLSVDVRVYPDFYNKDALDVDETNNVQHFILKTAQ